MPTDTFTSRLQLYQQRLPELLKILRDADYKPSLPQLLDAQSLLQQLANLPQAPTTHKEFETLLQALFAPLFCQTPQQQARFASYFVQWTSSLDQAFIAQLPYLEPDTAPQTSAPKPTPENPTWHARWQRFYRRLQLNIADGIATLRRYGRVGFFAALAMLGLAVLWLGATQLFTALPNTRTGGYWLLGLLILVLLAAWWLWQQLEAGFLARHTTALQPEQLRNFYVQKQQAELFHSVPLMKTAQQLRRHQDVPSDRLDVAATLHRTIRAGGWFNPVWKQDKQTPEYLVLIDRSSFHDQQTHLVEALLHPLRDEGVVMHLYYFDDDPRYCYPPEPLAAGVIQREDKLDALFELPSQQFRGLNLIELLAQHEAHRLLIFADGNRWFEMGQPARWLAAFGHLQYPALFTLAALSPARRTMLLAQGLAVFPTSSAGLQAFAEYLETEWLLVQPTGASLPSLLARTPPTQWISSLAPEPEMQMQLLDELHRYLGESWQWFCACALYPELRWPLTLELGMRLMEDDQEQLIQQLPLLARLPWFRYSSMPNWLRLAVLKRLSWAEEQALRELFKALLQPSAGEDEVKPEGNITLVAGRVSWWTRLKAVWQPPVGTLKDRVLLSFLGGRLSIGVGRESKVFLRKAISKLPIFKLTNIFKKIFDKSKSTITNIQVSEQIYDTNAQDLEPIYEAKLLIIGEGGAGKTTLAWRLINPDGDMPNQDQSTEGIDVWHKDLDCLINGTKQTLRLNIWDFGGQDIYHATHQFFLSRNALYALVADSRREDTDFFWWLSSVEKLGGDSPVLLVKNERDERAVSIDEGSLLKRFHHNLKSIRATNLATHRGLPEFTADLRHHVQSLEHIGQQYPKRWKQVRERLEQRPEPYISWDEYRTVCHTTQLPDDSAAALMTLLHNLGVCLYFEDVPLLTKTVILKPSWATEAVYRVLDDRDVQLNTGHFTRQDVQRIWQTRKKSRNSRFADCLIQYQWQPKDYAHMHHELLEMMQKFELCYQLPNDQGYIAPSLLDKHSKQDDYEFPNGGLKIIYDYTGFMPKGLTGHLLVRRYEWIEGDRTRAWRYGAVLSHQHTRAEIIEDRDRREFSLRLVGDHCRDMATVLMDEMDTIQRRFKGLEYKVFIPCQCGKQVQGRFELDYLRKAANQATVVHCRECLETRDANRILSGVFTPNRMEREVNAAARRYQPQTKSPHAEALDMLKKLSKAQFEAVVFLYEAPEEYLPGTENPTVQQAIALLKYAEQQDGDYDRLLSVLATLD